MLNQSDPAANYLLERKVFRNLPRETQVKDTSGEDWMLPFAENLGVVPSEFQSWKPVFGAHSAKVILVEGDLDKEYFEHFRENYSSIYNISSDIEIVPYGGKDSLKNTSILQFMINKFGKVFITFDLDAKTEVENSLRRIGLQDSVDYCSIGLNKPGSDCIEGLLPISVKQKVYSEQHELVTTIASQDTKARNMAKSSLKRCFLEEFRKNNYKETDLAEFRRMFSAIAKAFA